MYARDDTRTKNPVFLIVLAFASVVVVPIDVWAEPYLEVDRAAEEPGLNYNKSVKGSLNIFNPDQSTRYIHRITIKRADTGAVLWIDNLDVPLTDDESKTVHAPWPVRSNYANNGTDWLKYKADIIDRGISTEVFDSKRETETPTGEAIRNNVEGKRLEYLWIVKHTCGPSPTPRCDADLVFEIKWAPTQKAPETSWSTVSTSFHIEYKEPPPPPATAQGIPFKSLVPEGKHCLVSASICAFPILPPTDPPQYRYIDDKNLAFYLGDTHAHTPRTRFNDGSNGRFPIDDTDVELPKYDNAIENGYTLTKLMKEKGYSWAAITDHCYSMNYNDYVSQAGVINRHNTKGNSNYDPDFVVLRGMEMSAREKHGSACVDGTGNRKHETMHFNAIGLASSPTKGSSGCFPDPLSPSYTKDPRRDVMTQYICRVKSSSFAPSTQPGDAVPPRHVAALVEHMRSKCGAQVIVVNHPGGLGSSEDGGPNNYFDMADDAFRCLTDNVEDGIEVINFEVDSYRDNFSQNKWRKERLLKGQMVAAYGGTDVHHTLKHLGNITTGVLINSPSGVNEADVIGGLQFGRTFAAGLGNAIAIWVREKDMDPATRELQPGPWYAMGNWRSQFLQVKNQTEIEIAVKYIAGKATGRINIIKGDLTAKDEDIVAPRDITIATGGDNALTETLEWRINSSSKDVYFRAEIYADQDGSGMKRWALSSPVRIKCTDCK